MAVILGSTLLLLPIVVGIWATAWALEDAGVIHYNISKDRRLFEIEPVHYKYKSILNSYIDISVIIALISIVVFHITYSRENMSNILLSIFTIPMVMMFSFVTYVVYWKSGKNFIVKNMKEIRTITEDELEVFLDKQAI